MSAHELRIKRVYDEPAPADGYRVLVDRLWPRGVTKERADLDLWLKDVAPSPDLRKRWHHDKDRFAEFTDAYRLELETNPAVDKLRKIIRENAATTLIFAAHDPEVNHAAVLRDFLERGK
ncbi:DUF488 domain-containing protein [Jongsikchunia kroppenstedtii]|uniref:DUF488 domain-containing protein n=1 Tax=Jongsikchunia kroppenstedtii TaxID=1121721 RepID=UPI00037A93B8|nr:DUF488 family protein [Jongsikchunia kroppenstedtii]